MKMWRLNIQVQFDDGGRDSFLPRARVARGADAAGAVSCKPVDRCYNAQCDCPGTADNTAASWDISWCAMPDGVGKADAAYSV